MDIFNKRENKRIKDKFDGAFVNPRAHFSCKNRYLIMTFIQMALRDKII